ncbi:MAG: hypothetical protein PHY28_03535 [Dehalococcoidales bacterium]|nr:hypothetical protein [Dehalococcoidales bacterium]
MLQIEFVPDLDHCIETLARKEYSEIVSQLLSSGKNKRKISENTKKAELLKNFLETADFKKLRAESEGHIINGRLVKFVVYTESRVTKYEMRISPEP